MSSPSPSQTTREAQVEALVKAFDHWEAPFTEEDAERAIDIVEGHQKPQLIEAGDCEEGKRPNATELSEMLGELQSTTKACIDAVADDPGCVDPDRTMVPFEELQALSSRLNAAVWGTGKKQPHPVSVKEGGRDA